MIIPTIIFSVITFLFYTKYFDMRYKKHFENVIYQNYALRIGTKARIEFTEEYIYSNSLAGEGKIYNHHLSYIADLPKQFLIFLKMGEVIILPKRDFDADQLKREFEALGFPIIDELDWKE